MISNTFHCYILTEQGNGEIIESLVCNLSIIFQLRSQILLTKLFICGLIHLHGYICIFAGFGKEVNIHKLLLIFFLQKRSFTWRYPERHQYRNLAEYCYTIEAEVAANSKLTTAKTGEMIAMTLVALVNSGGGLLVIPVVTKAGDVYLDNCEIEIIRLITQQEKWIPEDLFNNHVNCEKNATANELHFFVHAVSKTTQLVTYHSNSFCMKHNHPESIVNNDELVGMVNVCTCENEKNM